VRHHRLYRQARRRRRFLMEGLHRLEYRGYDSAGDRGRPCGRAAAGQVQGAGARARKSCCPARFQGRPPGIAHTRLGDAWRAERQKKKRPPALRRRQTASRSSTTASSRMPWHCGRGSKAPGVVFRSETDSEVLAHLIAAMPERSLDAAVARAALRLVTGTYGLAVLDAARPEAIVVARNGQPGGAGSGARREMFVASDATALGAAHPPGSSISTTARGRAGAPPTVYEIATLDGGPTAKTPSTITWTNEAFDKGEFAHFMRKEIAEQPEVGPRRTLSGRLEPRFQATHLGGIEFAAHELLDIRRVKILGCGSAYIAGAIGAPPDRAAGAAAGACRARLRVSATATRSSSATRSTSPSANRAKPLTPGSGAGSEAQGRGACSASSTSSAARSRGEMRPRHLPARRSRNCCRVDQDLHLHRRCLRPARHPSRPDPRSLDPAAGGRLLTALAALPEQIDGIIAAAEAEIARFCRAARPLASTPISSGPLRGLRGGDGGGAQAQGGQLPARRSLLGGPSSSTAPLALISPETPTIAVDAARTLSIPKTSRRSRKSAPRRGAGLRRDPRPARCWQRPTQCSTYRAPSQSSIRSCSTSRCSCSPTMSPSNAAATSIKPRNLAKSVDRRISVTASST